MFADGSIVSRDEARGPAALRATNLKSKMLALTSATIVVGSLALAAVTKRAMDHMQSTAIPWGALGGAAVLGTTAVATSHIVTKQHEGR